MNIQQRLTRLEGTRTYKQISPSQLAYLEAMVKASKCNKTTDELDNGRGLGITELVLTAYGLDRTDRTITELPNSTPTN